MSGPSKVQQDNRITKNAIITNQNVQKCIFLQYCKKALFFKATLESQLGRIKRTCAATIFSPRF